MSKGKVLGKRGRSAASKVSQVDWQYFPKNAPAPDHLISVVSVMNQHLEHIGSGSADLSSDEVLLQIRGDLEIKGYRVEKGKKAQDKVIVPVLFGQNGAVEKSFGADAFDPTTGTVIEIEAGRGVTNYQFLKDFFQACMMVSARFLVIAVRKNYRGNNDFRTVILFFDAMYASGRLKIPLEGILVVGY